MTRRSWLPPLVLLTPLALLLGACDVTASLGPGDNPPIVRPPDGGVVPDGLSALRLEPEDIRLRIVGDEPVTQELTVIGIFDDGSEAELSLDQFPVMIRVLDTDLGVVDRDTFRSFTNFGGTSQLEARLANFVAFADLTLAYERRVEIAPRGGGSLPERLAELFATAEANGEDAARAPEIVYPIDGVLLPPNLGGIDLQFTAGSAANDVFELSFTNAITDVRFYALCDRPDGIGADGECILEVGEAGFKFLAETNRGGETLDFQVRATDVDGSALGVSNVVSLGFTEDDINGTIYYWSVSERAIIRFDFGDAEAEPELVVAPSDAGGTCVGCHAITRDGSKVLASVGGQGRGGVMLRDLETPRGEEGDFIWDAPGDRILQFASFAPDGDEFVGVFGDSNLYEDPDGAGNFGDLILFETDCADVPDGCQTGRIDLGGREASHPDWAPTDHLIAFTDVGINGTSQRPRAGAISFVRRDDADSPWGSPDVRIPRAEGLSRYNPSFSPEDAEIFAFNESTCPGGDQRDRACNADSDPTAKVWVAETDGTADPVFLTNAMRAGPTDEDDDLANTFPRFAPFVFTLESGEFGDRTVLWLTFATIRRYGFREPPGPATGESIRGTWLWMVAVEPDKVARGEDPSFTPFLLPFQDLGTSNHIAVWTERSVGDPILR